MCVCGDSLLIPNKWNKKENKLQRNLPKAGKQEKGHNLMKLNKKKIKNGDPGKKQTYSVDRDTEQQAPTDCPLSPAHAGASTNIKPWGFSLQSHSFLYLSHLGLYMTGNSH